MAISSKEVKATGGGSDAREQVAQLRNPVLAKNLSPIGNGLVPKQQIRYGKGANNRD